MLWCGGLPFALVLGILYRDACYIILFLGVCVVSTNWYERTSEPANHRTYQGERPTAIAEVGIY
jgi:hypothetical protein